jgi:hypothetical protein
MDLMRPRVVDDRGSAMPLARGKLGLTTREAVVYLLGAVWVGLVWSPDYVPSLRGFVGALVVIALVHAASQIFYAPRILHLARRRGECASCGYDLAGIRAELDGCTVCPECGAAWSLG